MMIMIMMMIMTMIEMKRKNRILTLFSPTSLLRKKQNLKILIPITIINQLINHHHHHRHLEWKTKIMKTENVFCFPWRFVSWGWLFTFGCYWILFGKKIKHFGEHQKMMMICFSKKTET